MLNRSAVVVTPSQPFLDWLPEADPTSRHISLRDLAHEPRIFLLPECDTNEEVDAVLRDLCEEIFADQLDGWYRDPATWPNDRSFDVFCRWFDCRHHSVLIDLCEVPLNAESV